MYPADTIPGLEALHIWVTSFMQPTTRAASSPTALPRLVSGACHTVCMTRSVLVPLGYYLYPLKSLWMDQQVPQYPSQIA